MLPPGSARLPRDRERVNEAALATDTLSGVTALDQFLSAASTSGKI
jgi:hypothetical protein